MTVRKIGSEEKEQVKEVFLPVFTDEPWYDDWSDPEQLDLYLMDLMGQGYSLAFGLFDGEELIGASLGYVKHWYSGTEYCIDELFIANQRQGKGLGTFFLGEIEKAVREMGLFQIFLLTDRDAPAYDFYRKNGYTEIPENTAFWKKV
ncbi:MAG: GNAT family N-acetyltransferase [Oscillospiraceae bacterium]|nr:GNAT family N-acetyltransferase [Oscillospiraceae bacterium]